MKEGNAAFPFPATDSGGTGGGLPLLEMAACGAGAVLTCLLVSVVVARRLRPRLQKTAVEVTLTPTASDGYDPDVVQSIQCRPHSLDVLPHMPAQDAHEQDGRKIPSHESHKANKGFVAGDHLCTPGDPRKHSCNRGHAQVLDTCIRRHSEEKQVSVVFNRNQYLKFQFALEYQNVN